MDITVSKVTETDGAAVGHNLLHFRIRETEKLRNFINRDRDVLLDGAAQEFLSRAHMFTDREDVIRLCFILRNDGVDNFVCLKSFAEQSFDHGQTFFFAIDFPIAEEIPRMFCIEWIANSLEIIDNGAVANGGHDFEHGEPSACAEIFEQRDCRGRAVERNQGALHIARFREEFERRRRNNAECAFCPEE